MLYVFLDIDGVLNTSSEWKQSYSLNKECIKNFATFFNKYKDARLVLSSSWRAGFSYTQKCLPHIEELKKELLKYGITIYGKTPTLKDKTREDEIKEYITTYNVKDYVIIDDDSSLFSKKCKNLYIVNANTGFTVTDIKLKTKIS